MRLVKSFFVLLVLSMLIVTTSCGAVYAEKIYDITVNRSPVRGGEARASTYGAAEGTEITLTAIPYAGYIFSYWRSSSDGVHIGGVLNPRAKFTMPSNPVTVTAVFRKSGDDLGGCSLGFGSAVFLAAGVFVFRRK